MRRARLETFSGNFLQVSSAYLFASYFFIFPFSTALVGALSPLLLDVFSWRTIFATYSLYVLQLFIYRPHRSVGWPGIMKRFLYGPLVDYVLHYYDATCIREGPAPDPEGKYLFAMYPHGVYGVCRAFSGGDMWRSLYPGIFARWGSFGMAFSIPGVREFSLSCGCLDASKPVLEAAIRHGENIILLPGGIDEMNLTDGKSTDTKLVTLDRKGFAKLAIENGLDIIPGFCFGEKWIHETVRLPAPIRALLRPLRMSGTLLRGRGFTLLGFLKPSLGFVWGEPISVRQQKPVDDAYLDEIHGKVITSVAQIFERHKSRFGYPDEETLTMVSVADAKAANCAPKSKRV